MLQNNNLIKKNEINFIFKKGKSFNIKELGFKFIYNDLNINRYCIIINSKTVKKAVRRNKLKRQIKNILKTINFVFLKGIDVVIITRPEISEKKFLEIKRLIEYSFKRILSKK